MEKETLSERRKRRVRFRLAEKSRGRMRLSVFRSNKYIYAQVIDDEARCTLVSASSLEKDFRTNFSKTWDCDAAHAVGKCLAERAVARGIREVVFDRGGCLFHGRIKALAEGARSAGLSF
ncbi:MAG: 50S ribosomal protein L18 [Holosporales bacterium]|jgi:large subunit ribosomal protein L18|nr:50S ribosomal protein L18 [Holosporales bacterium]